MFLIHSVQSAGSKKSAIRGIQIVKKLINCDLTYENGVFNPYNALLIKIRFVKTDLKN